MLLPPQNLNGQLLSSSTPLLSSSQHHEQPPFSFLALQNSLILAGPVSLTGQALGSTFPKKSPKMALTSWSLTSSGGSQPESVLKERMGFLPLSLHRPAAPPLLCSGLSKGMSLQTALQSPHPASRVIKLEERRPPSPSLQGKPEQGPCTASCLPLSPAWTEKWL